MNILFHSEIHQITEEKWLAILAKLWEDLVSEENLKVKMKETRRCRNQDTVMDRKSKNESRSGDRELTVMNAVVTVARHIRDTDRPSGLSKLPAILHSHSVCLFSSHASVLSSRFTCHTCFSLLGSTTPHILYILLFSNSLIWYVCCSTLTCKLT